MAPRSPPTPNERPLPPPVETPTKVRRFAPEPVEITLTSNRTAPTRESQSEANSAAIRRFSPQPIETSFINSKTLAKESQHQGQEQCQSRIQNPTVSTSFRRILPQPIESSVSSSTTRRFSPQLVESSKRSRKSGDSGPTILAQDKTDHSPEDQDPSPLLSRSTRPFPVPLPPENSPVVSSEDIHAACESRFSSSALRKKEPRRHSFKVPDLPPIQSMGDSEGSNESACPSLSTSPSALSDEVECYKNKAPRRKSGNDKTTGYILSLAAQAAEKQLREQVMAAYPNENMHEPVDHFAVDREDDAEDESRLGHPSKDTPKVSYARKRDSHIGWDISEMRRHQETLEKQANKGHATIEPEIGAPRGAKELFQLPAQSMKDFKSATKAIDNTHGGLQRDVEMEKMRNAASPPMAGENLQFQIYQSPRQTRLDVTQYPCGQSQQEDIPSRKDSGLWAPADRISKQGSIPGLWMGTSTKPMESSAVHTGILTPAIEREDPFTTSSTPPDRHQLPTSPPASQGDSKVSCLDAILSQEQQMALEFHDVFVTQVYNYLSLGYPSLARKFDAELSKISKVPVDELRQDDSNVNAKGHIGAPECSGTQIAEGREETVCARWRALRKYVREWARQQSHMGKKEEGAGGEWGQRARRGSWAL